MRPTYLSIVKQYLVPSLHINACEDKEVRPQSPAASGTTVNCAENCITVMQEAPNLRSALQADLC